MGCENCPLKQACEDLDQQAMLRMEARVVTVEEARNMAHWAVMMQIRLDNVLWQVDDPDTVAQVVKASELTDLTLDLFRDCMQQQVEANTLYRHALQARREIEEQECLGRLSKKRYRLFGVAVYECGNEKRKERLSNRS